MSWALLHVVVFFTPVASYDLHCIDRQEQYIPSLTNCQHLGKHMENHFYISAQHDHGFSQLLTSRY